MNKWENLFASHILDRGLDYYQSGYVGKIEPIEKGFTALVEGSYSQEYGVDIIVEDGQVKDMFCDCPYAEDGNHCKHMAAVLYKISENGFEKYVQTQKKDQEKERQELVEIISRIPQDELRKLILQVAIKDNNFKSDIFLKYAGKISKQRMEELENQIDDIAAKFSRYYGYIEWDDIYNYISELESFIDDTVHKLLENKHCLEAFELINKVFSSVDEQDMDDENDEVLQLADTCYELWKDILEECNDEQQRHIYEVMRKAKNDSCISELAKEYMNNFLVYEFRDESVQREKLETLDQEIEQAFNNLSIQVRDKYISYVKEYAEHASDRNAYRNIMTYLKKIKTYPEGEEITNKISAEWRVQYKRRRAMMEELKVAGF